MKYTIRNMYADNAQEFETNFAVYIDELLQVGHVKVKNDGSECCITLSEHDTFIVEKSFNGLLEVKPAPLFDWVDVTLDCEMDFMKNGKGEYLLELYHKDQMVGMIGSNQWEAASGDGSREDSMTDNKNYRIIAGTKTFNKTNWFKVEHWEGVN